jgi:long-chain acyl-CoA synthetase
MSTLPKLLIERAAATPNAVATRVFRLGKWDETTWSQVHAEAAKIGTALRAVGVARGDVVAVVGDNEPDWLPLEIGAQSIGAIVLSVPPNLTPQTTASAVGRVAAKVAVVSDQEQFDKLDERRSALPMLTTLAVIHTRGIRWIDDDSRTDATKTCSLAQLRGHGTDDQAGWDATASAVASEDPAWIAATIDNGQLRLLRSSHAQLIAAADSVCAAAALGITDRVVAQHTLAEPVEQVVSVVASLQAGFAVHYAEAGSEAQAMRQVQPTVVHLDPEWLAGAVREVSARQAGTKGIKRLALQRGLVPKPPPDRTRTGPFARPTRTYGLVAGLLAFLLLLVTPHGNDVARVVGVAVIFLLTGLALAAAGASAGGPIRRRLGLSNCRACLNAAALPSGGADLLGALDVPVVAVAAAVGETLTSAKSEVAG